MSEVYSKTPPTEPGWYWLRHGNYECVRRFQQHEQDITTRQWVFGDYIATSSDLIDDGYEFGPRVPSVAELAAIQADQARLAWLFRTVLQAWPREKVDAQMARDAELLQACNEEYDTDEDFMDPECP